MTKRPKAKKATRPLILGLDDNSPIIIGDSGTTTIRARPLVNLPNNFLCIRHGTFHCKHDVSVTNQNYKVLSVANSATTVMVTPPWILTLNGGAVTIFSVDNLTVNIVTDGADYDMVARQSQLTDLIIGTSNLTSASLTNAGTTTNLYNGSVIQVNFVHV